MIYISSACVKHSKIKNSIIELVNHGFYNIELSGGTEYYEGLESDLLELKDKYNLNYICHNYFPPPEEHFVLNLASLDNKTYEKTFQHLEKAILLSKKLGSKKFGFHAGFFIDIPVNEIGKRISKLTLFNKNEAIQRFCEGFNLLNKISDIELYLENNVFSSTNFRTYNGNNIFMLSNYKDYQSLKSQIDFNLLLDIAHLKVSSKTLNLNSIEEITNMMQSSDYIHLSDNDGFHDLNHPLRKNSSILSLISNTNLKEKNFTLEIYDSIEEIQKSYKILMELING